MSWSQKTYPVFVEDERQIVDRLLTHRDLVCVAAVFHLTLRESETLHLIVHGKSDREIAKSLGISRWTAKAHTASVRRKLEVETRDEVALRVMSLCRNL